MATIKTHRDLIAWQKGRQLVKTIYQFTRFLPASEQFGLTNQMRRAAVSIPSNIAEGCARQSLPEYLRFLRMARGSIAELDTQLVLCEDLEFATPESHLLGGLAETDRVLQGLIRSLEAKQN
ncbi:MAG: four helix bundle protein [Phycisphaerales bacterium]|nr:four helix bundle protein [Phycisphaerales bacterium]